MTIRNDIRGLVESGRQYLTVRQGSEKIKLLKSSASCTTSLRNSCDCATANLRSCKTFLRSVWARPVFTWQRADYAFRWIRRNALSWSADYINRKKELAINITEWQSIWAICVGAASRFSEALSRIANIPIRWAVCVGAANSDGAPRSAGQKSLRTAPNRTGPDRIRSSSGRRSRGPASAERIPASPSSTRASSSSSVSPSP